MKKLTLPAILVMATMIFSACAPSNDTLTVNDAWARPAPKGQNGAVYFIIQNNTVKDDALIGASTDIASTAEAHMSMVNKQDVVSMSMQEAVQIPAGESITFKQFPLVLAIGGGLLLVIAAISLGLQNTSSASTQTPASQFGGEDSERAELIGARLEITSSFG